MLRNYLNIIYQNFQRHTVYSLINCLGLAAGLAVCMVIFQFVRFENSYDDYHVSGEDTYRVILEYPSDVLKRDAAVFAPTGPAMKSDFPEVKSFTRISPEYSRTILHYEQRTFEESKVYYADSTFFSIFNYSLIEGVPNDALKELNTIVLSLKSAEKYFGPRKSWKESPLNKMLIMNNTRPVKITGIMDIPDNSHFKCDALISFTTFIARNDPSREWNWNDFYTYVVLEAGTEYKTLEGKLPSFIRKYQGQDTKSRLLLQPIQDIHLHSNVGFELGVNGNAQSVIFLGLIGAIVLVIAWVNYVNLATARAEKRAKEIGIRKVNGAGRPELIGQFLLESFAMNLLSLLVAISIVTSLLPLINVWLSIPIPGYLWMDGTFIGAVLVVYITGSLVSGFYPAIVLSSFKPASILKGSPSPSPHGNSFVRQTLVIFQFVISTTLITGVIIIVNQLNYIHRKDLGFSYGNRIILNTPGAKNDSLFAQNYQKLKTELLRFAEIEGVAVSSAIPSRSYTDLDTHGDIKLNGKGKEEGKSFTGLAVDESFVKVYDLTLLAGTTFTEPITRHNQLIVNRSAMEWLGISDPEEMIGRKVDYGSNTREVVGVVENYHHKSLKNTFEPIIFRSGISNMLYITVELDAATDTKNVVEKMRTAWGKLFSDEPFVYSFLDDHVEEQYKADLNFKRIFTAFSGFSIAISCLGLFGLVSYSTTVRFKEIGIRKILGASIASIYVLFAKSYIRLLFVGLLIGLPLAHYSLNLWLTQFAFRAALSWWVFVIPPIVIALLALASVSLQIIRVALTNPVDSLRHD